MSWFSLNNNEQSKGTEADTVIISDDGVVSLNRNSKAVQDKVLEQVAKLRQYQDQLIAS